ncbi:MAG: amidohydrolase, partial [Limnochordia bacterium]
MGRILIKGATLLSSPQATPTVGDILIDGAYIKEVGAVGDVPVDEIIDGRGFLATPGLINGHSHVAMGFFRGWPDDLPLQTWLEEWIWPAEAKLTVEDVYWGSLLGIGEMLLAGVTAFADMYILMEGVAQAVYDSGARANLSRGIVCAEPGEVGLRENIQLVEKWHGRGDGRISVSFAPHAIYTCPPPFLREVVAEARRRDVGLHMHVSETAVEVEDCRRQWGQSPVEVLAEEGFLDRRLLAAHCVHLSSRDLDLLAQGGCYVAHNPTSNLKLASGIAPVPEMAAREIPVLLGTDGPA